MVSSKKKSKKRGKIFRTEQMELTMPTPWGSWRRAFTFFQLQGWGKEGLWCNLFRDFMTLKIMPPETCQGANYLALQVGISVLLVYFTTCHIITAQGQT